MKKFLCALLSVVLMFSFFNFDTIAVSEEEIDPYVVDITITTASNFTGEGIETRASGLITSYGIFLEKSGTTLTISGRTYCSTDVVKCGFKNLTVERRKTSSDSWTDYYEYGNVYLEATSAVISTTLVVASGYQYRISCKHYAKKNLLVTQNISNTSNIVTVS